jgi:hypothetical protein
MVDYENPWLYQGKPFSSDDIQDYYGFVYCLTDSVNNRKYIGRKYFWSIRTVKKVKGRRKKNKSESDWKDYYGSSKVILEIIEQHGKERFKREILSLHKTKGEVNYQEVKTQFIKEVLEAVNENNERVYYNENIANRYFYRNRKEGSQNDS